MILEISKRGVHNTTLTNKNNIQIWKRKLHLKIKKNNFGSNNDLILNKMYVNLKLT
jgi:hypothetical protein